MDHLTNFAFPSKHATQRCCSTRCQRHTCGAATPLRHSYQNRLSGPFLDRLDLRIEVPVIPPAQLAAAPDGETSTTVAARVAVARENALARQGCANAQLSSSGIDQHCSTEPAALALLQKAAAQLAWSGRSYHRVLRVARTIADLAGSDRITPAQMGEAIQLRRGLQPA